MYRLPAGSILFCNTPHHSLHVRNASDTQLADFGCLPTRLACGERAVFPCALQPPGAGYLAAQLGLSPSVKNDKAVDLSSLLVVWNTWAAPIVALMVKP